MATNNCTNCGCTKPKCGCQDTMLTTPAPCPTPVGCPDPEPCSEVFDAQCVIYTGDSILCAQDVVVTTSSNVADALNDIVDYICQELPVNVTLTDAGTGTHQSLVNDGTGPTLAVKGLKAGTGISVSSTSTDITVTNSAPDLIVALTAGTGIDITGAYPNFTIINDAPNVDQNLWATFAATTGSTTADTTTDTLTVVGTGGIATSISGDTLTIDGSGITSQFAYEIGQYVAAEGGVIANRWLSTTAGGVPENGTVQNYLVIDVVNLASSFTATGAYWSTLSVFTGINNPYDGQANTAALIALGPPAGITPGTAAEICYSSTNAGKSDWYLPAIHELSGMQSNLLFINQGLTVAGGTLINFDDNIHWSSTENSTPGFAHSYCFYCNDLFFVGNKTTSQSTVRAMRKFSI